MGFVKVLPERFLGFLDRTYREEVERRDGKPVAHEMVGTLMAHESHNLALTHEVPIIERARRVPEVYPFRRRRRIPMNTGARGASGEIVVAKRGRGKGFYVGRARVVKHELRPEGLLPPSFENRGKRRAALRF
jgi:hypothetical protein